MRKRLWNRGAAIAAVVAIVVALILAGVGYWFYQRGGEVSGSAWDLADYLPKSARAVWMMNLNGQVDREKLLTDYGEIVAKLPPEKKKKLEESLQTELGVTLTELSEFFDGRAGGGVLQRGGEPGAIGLIGLRDAEGLDNLVKSKLPKGTASEKIAGVTFNIFPDGQCYGQDGTWAYLADSKASAELLLASAAGKDTLASDPAFMEARGRVVEGGSLMGFYWDIAGTVKGMEGISLPYTDPQTFKDLACLEYAVGSMDWRNQEANAFLKVLDDKSTLSQKLLSKGSVTPISFGALAKGVNEGHALDLKWTFDTLVQLGMLSPSSRQASGMASAGLGLYGNPFAAFEGDIAITSNAMETLLPVLTKNFGTARAQGQLTACKSNLMNLGTGLEMWSTDHEGRYPPSMSELTPNYLKAIPECPAAAADTYSSTYKVGTNPDSYEFACSGNHHQQASENLPAYNSTEGLIPGVALEGDDSSEEAPSVAVTALVKDIKAAHALLAKGLGDSVGSEPKPGEEKVYQIPGLTMIMKTETPARLILGYGEKSAQLLDTKGGSLSEQAKLKKALAWGGDGVIYADYLNLNPLIDEVAKAIPSDDKPESQMARTVLDKFKDFDMEGASCLTVRADGLQWKGYGMSGGVVMVAGMGAAILVPNFIRARAQGQTTACKSNLRNIGTAMEMWSTDNQGHYPKSLEQLIPNYLRALPECPVAGAMTYKAYFGKKALGNKGEYADYYYIECHGGHHTAVGIEGNFPAYNSVEGFIESAQ